MKELDVVVLVRPLPDEELIVGSLGTIVHEHDGGKAFEVEFLDEEGDTIAVETLMPTDLRPASQEELRGVGKVSA